MQKHNSLGVTFFVKLGQQVGKKDKILSILEVGFCKHCKQKIFNNESFVPIGKVINGKYIYKNVHYKCEANNQNKSKNKFDWQLRTPKFHSIN